MHCYLKTPSKQLAVGQLSPNQLTNLAVHAQLYQSTQQQQQQQHIHSMAHAAATASQLMHQQTPPPSTLTSSQNSTQALLASLNQCPQSILMSGNPNSGTLTLAAHPTSVSGPHSLHPYAAQSLAIYSTLSRRTGAPLAITNLTPSTATTSFEMHGGGSLLLLNQAASATGAGNSMHLPNVVNDLNVHSVMDKCDHTWLICTFVEQREINQLCDGHHTRKWHFALNEWLATFQTRPSGHQSRKCV